MAYSFLPNAMHELGHGTVFKTKALNEFFTRLTGFLGWNNFQYFAESHSRHHRYTLHPPDDLEVVLPTRAVLKQCLTQGIVGWPRAKWTVLFTIRIARGKFVGEWENAMYPALRSGKAKTAAQLRPASSSEASALIIAAAIIFHLWLLPGGRDPGAVLWRVALLPLQQQPAHRPARQRAGLPPLLPDHPARSGDGVHVLASMNYHTEHCHMYAAVPCYNLPRLHRLIEHDMPHCPRGLVETWRTINEIQRRQKADPTYRNIVALPPAAAPAELAGTRP